MTAPEDPGEKEGTLIRWLTTPGDENQVDSESSIDATGEHGQVELLKRKPPDGAT